MLAIVLTVNVLLLVGLICVAFVAGFVLRSEQLKKCRRKIIELEREILRGDASILEIEKEKADLLRIRNESFNKDQP